MNELSRQAIEQSGYRRDGFADHYNAFRPKPPAVLLDALTRYAGGPPLRCVVDLGSGTGLSTRAWAARAGEVVGVEANESMRAVAERETVEENVRYVAGFASETGLPDGVADLVTCSQSFHWMEPAPTLAEAARLLRRGGVFAAYDYDTPPLVHPEIDAAFADHLARRRRLRDEHRVEAGWTRTPKASHLERIQESGHFRHAREAVFHDEAEVGADDVIGFAHSLGLVPELRALGATEEELGLTRLAEVTRQVLGTGRISWTIGYRVRLGVKPA
jgi:ubiquinone/menaquinone biosynthesis C-methylase UbiE